MKNLHLKIILLLSAVFLIIFSGITQVNAQTISGKVISASDNEPLPGVNVVVKGTTNGTITDAQGNFSLDVPNLRVTLRFSFIGFQTKEIALNSRTNLNVKLELETQELEDVVVIGYGSVKEEDVSGAISVVSEKELNRTPNASLGKAIQGKATGVMVTQSGSPGGGVNMRVRGIGSISRDPDPLYVIDGVVDADINSIAPQDIKSISVLKDAASAAIYGANAANGVVLIETKRGKSGETKVNFSSFHGINRITKQYELMNADQYADFYNTILTENGEKPDRAYTEDFRKTYYGEGWQEGTNWQDEILQESYTQNYYLRISGGAKNSNYSVSANYYKESGLLINSEAERYNLRANADFNIGEYIKIGESLNLTRRRVSSSSTNAFNMALRSSPLSKVYNPYNKGGYEGHQITYAYLKDTLPEQPIMAIPLDVYNENPDMYPQADTIYPVPNTGGSDQFNPRAFIENGDGNTYYNNILANVFLEVNPFPWLSIRSTPSIIFDFTQQKSWSPGYEAGVRSRPNASLDHNFSESWKMSIENKMAINKKFGKHNLDFIAVHHYREGVADNTTIEATEFEYEQLNVVSQAGDKKANGSYGSWSQLSYISRLIYNYNSKYILQASVRHDGSSNFAKGRRFGTFPAFSAAWKLNQDLFPAFEPIDMFKLRVGWGQTGNSNIGRFNYQTQISRPSLFQPVFGESQKVALAANELTSIGNPFIKWESADMYNLGFDLNALNNKIQFSTEYYIKRQNDLLIKVPISASTGRNALGGVMRPTASPWMNIGKVENRGFEFDLRYSKMEGKFNYNIAANLSTVKNEVISLPNDIRGGNHITTVGHAIGSLYGYVAEGIIQPSDFDEVIENEDGTYQYSGYKYAIPTQGIPQPGDIRFKDLNRDGVITDGDRTIIGKAVPDFNYTLNIEAYYKNFDFSIFLFGMQNFEIFNSQRTNIETFQVQDMDYNKSAAWINNYWTHENQTTEYVRADVNNDNANSRFSSWWIEDGSFIRIKDVQLGYSFSDKFLNLLNLESFRIYVSAVNLFTFTKYKGQDPESPINSNDPLSPGIDSRAYPLPRTFNTGIQIDF